MGRYSRLGVDVADNSGFIKLGIAAAVGYFAYTKGWLSFLGIGSPAVAAPAPVPVPAPNPNAITGANTLDGIYTRLVAAAPSGAHGVDVWGSYLAPILGSAPPDPMPIFTAAVPGFARSQQLTAAQYWAVMAPVLKTQFGLAGLGIYGGLGAVMLSRGVH